MTGATCHRCMSHVAMDKVVPFHLVHQTSTSQFVLHISVPQTSSSVACLIHASTMSLSVPSQLHACMHAKALATSLLHCAPPVVNCPVQLYTPGRGTVPSEAANRLPVSADVYIASNTQQGAHGIALHACAAHGLAWARAWLLVIWRWAR